MFFIPLFGAAVSGKSINISNAKKAIVSLAGPLPGIILGIVLSFIYFRTDSPMAKQFAIMFLFLKRCLKT